MEIHLTKEEYNKLVEIKLLEKKETISVSIEDKCDNCKREWISNNRTKKATIVFHGGCLGCIAPLLHGLGICLSCNYCMGNSHDYQDRSIYKKEPLK